MKILRVVSNKRDRNWSNNTKVDADIQAKKASGAKYHWSHFTRGHTYRRSKSPFLSCSRMLHSWIYLVIGIVIGHYHGYYYHYQTSYTGVYSSERNVSPTIIDMMTTMKKMAYPYIDRSESMVGCSEVNSHYIGSPEKAIGCDSRYEYKSDDEDGWRTLHFFRGTHRHNDIDAWIAANSTAITTSSTMIEETAGTKTKMNMSKTNDTNQHSWFSQAAQDELVMALLGGKTNGTFLDLAANDATYFSNTYALERYHHWKGICIEPNPMYWSGLIEYRTCTVVAAVIGRERDEVVPFRYEAGDHGGIAGDGFDNGVRWRHPSHSRNQSTVPLLEIMQRFHMPHDIDYLSLDVEGAESFIMMNFPLQDYRIKIITAERLRGPIRAYLKAHGYEFVQKLTRWGEGLWIHSHYRDQLDMDAVSRFNFPR
jgi:hypothetical protein